jgi:phage repressor protein C with HTH and peptisase S24 domain/lambda repressor-like predicted transcriptional regulator
VGDELQQAARNYVDAVVKATGWNYTAIARRAGLASTTLTRFMNEPDIRHMLSARSIAKIAAGRDVPVAPEIGGRAPLADGAEAAGPEGAGRAGASRGGREFSSAPVAVPPPGPRDLPIRGHAKGGTGEAYFFDQGGVQAYAERPWFLMGVPTAYAIYIHNDSMEPVFRHGHLAYVNPAVPPSPGDDVVIHLRDGQGFVKRLLRRTARLLIAEQFNPPRELQWPAERIEAVHLIVASLRVRS